MNRNPAMEDEEEPLHNDPMWWARLEFLEADRPKLLVELLKEGHEALRAHLDEITMRAGRMGARLSQGNLEHDQIQEIVSYEVVAPPETAEDEPRPLPKKLQEKLRLFREKIEQEMADERASRLERAMAEEPETT